MQMVGDPFEDSNNHWALYITGAAPRAINLSCLYLDPEGRVQISLLSLPTAAQSLISSYELSKALSVCSQLLHCHTLRYYLVSLACPSSSTQKTPFSITIFN